jgi:hypothetical protein
MPELDSSLLLSTLRTELRAAWATLHAAHAQDQLYGFGVYTTHSASTLMVTAFSEAGLAQCVADYVGSKRGQGKDPALQRVSLRWSPCDSPLHEEGSGLLPKSDKIVQELDAVGGGDDEEDEEIDEDFDEEDDDFDFDDEEQDPAVGEVFRIAVQVLQEMDRDALFGTDAERERLVLCVWKGDQSNVERHDFAKALNPPSAAKRFGEEMNAGIRAFYKVYMPDQELPEDDVFE